MQLPTHSHFKRIQKILNHLLAWDIYWKKLLEKLLVDHRLSINIYRTHNIYYHSPTHRDMKVVAEFVPWSYPLSRKCSQVVFCCGVSMG